MVGIVVVSHSDEIARGVAALAREMAPPELAIEAAGGTGEPGVLGTSAERVREAIERAMSADGVLVLMDLGSALMSAELATELLDDAAGPVRLSAAPLIEGAVAAAVAAGGGATLEQVAAEAGRVLEMKAAQAGGDDARDSAEPGPGATFREPPDRPGPHPSAGADVEAELPVDTEVGLHARPAARFVETVARFDAEVLVARVGAAQPPVSARSLTNLVALGARRGDRIRVLASGAQAGDAVAALQRLAASGFGDSTEAPASGTVLQGIAASAGIAAGPARLWTQVTPSARRAGTASEELRLLDRALADARATLGADRERLRRRAGTSEAEIFDAHAALLEDEALLEPARAAIAAGATAEAAITEAAAQVAGIYRRLDDPRLAARAADVLDVGNRVATALTAANRVGAAPEADPRVGAAPEADPRVGVAPEADPRVGVAPEADPRVGAAPEADPRVSAAPEAERSSPLEQNDNDSDSHYRILVADELAPSQTVNLDPARVAGIATARGSATAHAAIIARALGIPAVVGLGEVILAVPNGTPLLLDGGAGTVTVAPDAERRKLAATQTEEQRQRGAEAREHAGAPARLAGGERTEVYANIGSVADAGLAVGNGAEGVGLLRTEFLFLERADLPGEDEQTETLREIARALDGRPLVVRTLDAGADKPLPALAMPAEANPFLGVRGVRVALRHPELLSTQLRAVLRVAAEYPLKLMLPMVAELAEIEAARALLQRAREATGIDAPLELGIMVEVPSAALMAGELAAHVDFFSVGSNDLTQYTLAAERGNAQLAELLGEPQPAVLRLIRATVAAARAHGRWVGVCGEMAGDPACAVLLAGLGVDELSMAPRMIPGVKQALRGVELSSARAAAELALSATSAEAARQYARELLAG